MGHYLRQLGVTGIESLGIHRTRVSSNRGNAYLPPVFPSRTIAKFLIPPAWDCKPSGGEVTPQAGQPSNRPGCFVGMKTLFKGDRSKALTHVEREDYSGR